MLKNNLAPICLFTYNRFHHTKQTINALQKNKLAQESKLFIFSDGPKNKQESQKVRVVKDYLKTIQGFKTIKIIERQKKYGLAKSIISGVTEIINQYGKIIVLEDDMITSHYFLEFMNNALNLYNNEKKVISIHGYIYPIKNLPETFFLKGADCWGWATWKRGWDLFEQDGQKLLTELENKKLEKAFDFNGAYDYTKMLKNQIKGKNDSWAIRWYASAFLHNKLTLYPGKSLIKNIGLDNSGTHCKTPYKKSKIFDTYVVNNPILLKRISVKKNRKAYQKIEEYLKSLKSNIFSILFKKCHLKKS